MQWLQRCNRHLNKITSTMCISGGKAPPLVWVAASLWAMGMVNASDENSACKNGDDDEVVDTWISDGGFFALFLGVCAMFWGLAAGIALVSFGLHAPDFSLHCLKIDLVCEEYFVPALNVLCEELNVPDDVAGAFLCDLAWNEWILCCTWI